MYKNSSNYLRFRSVDNVIKELDAFVKINPKVMVRFHDDDLLAHSASWLDEFASKYSRKIKHPFACFIHPNTVSREKVDCLKRAGCHDVEIGVQSISEQTRKNILGRNVTQEKLISSIGILNDSGLRIITDNILGLPGQSTGEMLDLLKFYNNNRVMKVYCFGFRYYPKTAIIEQVRAHTGLTDADIENLEEGINAKAFIQGGDWWTREIKQLQTFFTFLLYLPKSFNNIIIRRKWYRFFPSIPYSIAVIFSNWLRIPYKYNWALHITISRYKNYLKKVF